MPTFREVCPVLDIKKQRTEIFEALRDRGYCYVLNTGVTDEMVNRICMKSQQFWQLSREMKLKYRQGQDVTFSGYVPWGVHRPTANTPKELLKETLYDFKEAFDFLHPDNTYCKMPQYEQSKDFFHEAAEFFKICAASGKDIVNIVADEMNQLGKDGEYVRGCFQNLTKKENMSYMRVAYYPSNKMRGSATGIEFGKNTNRIGIHRDSAPFVAQIVSPDVRGLQIEDPVYGWFDVEKLQKDAMWIHVGQLGYHVTDRTLQQPLLHKVTLPEDPNAPDRYCIVNFLGADGEAVLRPMSYGDEKDTQEWTGLQWVSKALVKAKDVYGDAKPENGITNGHTENGYKEANGYANGHIHENGVNGCHKNGHTTNGVSNGVNGCHKNGHTANGVSNGHVNGHCNGYANGTH
jgi:isopenicillin N synthase-like dioxygenase